MRQVLKAQGHHVIGTGIGNAEVIADLGTPAGRASLVEQVTAKNGGSIDAVLAVAGVDIAALETAAINYFGAVATLQRLRPLLLRSSAPRAVAVSSITSVHPYDEQLLNMLGVAP